MSKEDFTETRPRRGDRGLFGMVLLFAGVAWFLSRAGMLHVAADTLLSILLVCIGAGLLLTRRSGRRAWPILLGGILLFVLMGSSASAHVHWGGSGGVTRFVPTSTRQLADYQIGEGEMRLDLTRLEFSGTTPVVAKVGFGDLEVTVPKGVAVKIDYKDVLGEVNIEGHEFSHGVGTDATWRSSGYDQASKRLNLDLEVGAGSINVTSGNPTLPTRPTVPTDSTLPPAPGSPK